MKNILVPCDFSQPAISAYRFALDIAQQSKGVVHLLNVIELPVMHDAMLAPVVNLEGQFLEETKEDAEKRFKLITDKYKLEGVSVIFKTQFGAVSRMILDYVDREEIDLVLMGSHGASGVREFFLGSNAEKIVRNSPVPVLVMKDYFKKPIRNIVFPNTFHTKDQEGLVMKVKALQDFFSATLHLVWINTPLNFSPDSITNDRMQTFAERFMLKNYTVNVFNHTDEERGILEFSNSVKGDLIAMGTHGRKGISHLINGSVTEDVANHHKGLVWTYAFKNQTVISIE